MAAASIDPRPTDKQRLIELLESFGMKRTEQSHGFDWYENTSPMTGLVAPRKRNEIRISVGQGCGGGMVFEFDADDKFKTYGGFPW